MALCPCYCFLCLQIIDAFVWQCCWQCCLVHWNVGLFCHIWDPWVSSSAAARGGAGEEWEWSPGGAGTPTLSSVVMFMGSAAVQGGTGARVTAPQQLEGWCLRPYCHCCPLTYGLGHCYSQDAGVLCTASPANTGISGAVNSAGLARNFRLLTLLPLVLTFPTFYMFQSNHL